MSEQANSATRLEAWLAISVERGFLTDQIPRHIAIASAYKSHLSQGCLWLDLGSGGGIPGLVIGHDRPDTRGILLDSGHRRCEFLREAIQELALDNLSVVEGRGEVLARSHDVPVDVVVARSFNPPPVTAEIAARFLKLGGLLVVSEPPDSRPERWPESGLRELGLEFLSIDDSNEQAHLAVLRKVAETTMKFPRRDGTPAKSPLW